LSIFERIDWTILALAQPPNRGVRVERNDETRSMSASLGEEGDVSSVKQIEDSVGEDPGSGDVREPLDEVFGQRLAGT